ncbi:MAG TPA: sigma-70 family RNA polymerase sigma factor [Actinomycetota bacterium]|nr:sigma-70 family RNA polymerase sigma factor [Actinomycetota bacterium]
MEGRPLEDAELARRAREGDDDAYEDLVKRYGPIAFRVAFLVTRDRDEAQDAAQEAFVKAYYALPRFRPELPFRPWLLRIVANEARNRARSGRRRERLALRAAAVSDRDAAPSPETAALAQEDRDALVAALNRLEPRDREVIGYRFLLGLSESETAEVLDVRPGTAKSRLSRAMAKLRELLEVGT